MNRFPSLLIGLLESILVATILGRFVRVSGRVDAEGAFLAMRPVVDEIMAAWKK